SRRQLLSFPTRRSSDLFSQLFPGVATLNFTAQGYGPSLDLRITRKEGVPVQVVPEGTPGAHIVALKRVNELDYYNLGRDQLAKRSEEHTSELQSRENLV